MRQRVLLILVSILGACAAHNTPMSKPDYDAALIDGAATFGHTVQPAPEMDLLWVSPEMAAFVDDSVSQSHFGFTRFRRLMAKLINSGFFIDQYDRTATYSAAQTFAAHKGNCLAYTNMFVALARQAGLEANYQLVDTRPTWDVESGYLVRNNHVNVVLESIGTPGSSDGEVTVDFNSVQVDPDTRSHVISDEYAASLFYANLSVERLHEQDLQGAFAYLKRAILTEPSNIDLWINLGALYSVLEQFTLAEGAYVMAMQLKPRDKTAISGLAKSLQRQGRLEEAERYMRLAQKYQNKNPYYHYAVAEQAYRNDSFEEALAAVNQAIQLKRNNPRFYALRAATAQELGDSELAKKSIELQRRHGRGRNVTFGLFD